MGGDERGMEVGLFRRRKARGSVTTEPSVGSPDAEQTVRSKVWANVFQGGDDLEVVGESHYQEALWALCGGTEGDRIRHKIIAVLVPDPDNPYDPNAISVQIEGNLVGHLPRDIAAQYLPNLKNLMARCGGYVALEGVIVGGGYRDDGPGRLGVWLDHDQRDFGVSTVGRLERSSQAGRPTNFDGVMRTGFSEAWLTDVEDDSYDLSWFNELPDADRPAIAMLWELLATDPDPIDRHFQFAELESRLYQSRDLYDTALQEYDEACRRHDAEMETIRQAFMAKWGKVPLLDTYRQMAIRQQKQKDWDAVVWWCERGLALYGNNAAREEAVEDLLKRRNRALVKLEAPAGTKQRSQSREKVAAVLAQQSDAPPMGQIGAGDEIEILVCTQCEAAFERVVVRGRKPRLCPECRSMPDAA